MIRKLSSKFVPYRDRDPLDGIPFRPSEVGVMPDPFEVSEEELLEWAEWYWTKANDLKRRVAAGEFQVIPPDYRPQK